MLVTNAEDPLRAQLAAEAASAAEIWMAVAYASPAGIDALDLIRHAEEKPVRLVVGRAGEEGLTAAALRTLEHLADRARKAGGGVRIAAPPSHAKLYAFLSDEGDTASYIGSSNLSMHGLETWREANLPLFGEPASAVLDEIRSAWNSGTPLHEADVTIAEPRGHIQAGDQANGNQDDVRVELAAGVDGEALKGVSLTLLDRSGEVQEKHGLNWGWAKPRPRSGKPRNPNDACIPLRARHLPGAEEVFGSVRSGTQFRAVMHDGTQMTLQLEGSVDLKGYSEKVAKQIASTPDKAEFGRWILRETLGVPEDRRVTRDDLDRYGRTEISFYSLGSMGSGEGRTVYVDFSRPQIRAMGRDWSVPEVRAAVEAYFAMLEVEEQGEDYTKAEYRRRTAARLADRSEGAVEYKFQNISAVLNDEGYRWLEGYKPASNYQQLLRPLVQDELRKRPSLQQRLRR